MTSGKINVQTENIFPIIKKFLYSDHEIFLRELVANAVDASKKIQVLTQSGQNKTPLGELAVTVTINKENKTLTVSDNGLGMTAEEVDKYINSIAFSGAEEFVQQYKNETSGNPLIGHFGLGFYSAFMVADKVELTTKSFKDASAVKWSCNGSTDFTLTETEERTTRGTDVVLYINSENEEFLEDNRVLHLLEKYCRFLPIEIKFNDKVINNPKPAWTVKPAELKDEDYLSFYKELYPMSEDPLFHIHLNVDYPFNLTGILYFPKLKHNLEFKKNKVQLYCNQVFVTDAIEGIVPDFLTLMHGVIDSPDIPLNVSRSYLQSDGNVKKIASHITKKVADKLEELFKENRQEFENKWDDIGIIIKYGMLSDEKFYDRSKGFCLLKNTDNKYFTMSEYSELVKLNQTDKDGKTVCLYTNNQVEQHSLIEAAKNRGYDVLQFNDMLDAHFINQLEYKIENTTFSRIDSDVLDNLIKKETTLESKLTDDDKKIITGLIEGITGKEKYSIQYENMTEADAPVTITQNEFQRRMKEMSATGGSGYEFMANLPDTFNLVVNTNHPVISKIAKETDAVKQKELSQFTLDLALISKGLLKGAGLTDFINRSINLIHS